MTSPACRHAPTPSQLVHLRPTDSAGFRVVGLAMAGTAGGLALSTADTWPAWALGQALVGLMLVQWFVILHECGHDTLFRTRRYNRAAGRVAAFFSLIPYHAWMRVHGRHHKWTGWQDLDPTTSSLVPRELRPIERAIVNTCWRFWIPLFSIQYRLRNYWHVARLLQMFPNNPDRRSILVDTVGLVGLYTAIVVIAGPVLVIQLSAAAILLSFGIEDLLLLSQHTHVPQKLSGGTPVRPFPAVEQEPFTRSLRLPAAVSGFILHFDAHELHHMYPFVPGYHLHKIRYATENEIGWWHWVRGAKQIPGDVLLFQNRLETGYDL